MLSPTINTTLDELTNSFAELIAINSFAYTCNNTVVGYLPDDPTWLASVRSRIGQLSTAAASWFDIDPDIRKPLILSFINYATTFEGVTQQVQNDTIKTSDEWITVFQTVLLPAINDSLEKTQKAQLDANTFFQPFKNIIPLIDQSIQEGWKELAAEEQEMVDIATTLGALKQEVAGLESELTSDMISSGKSYVSSEVTLMYRLLSLGEAVSFLSVGSLALTLGVGIYDMISTSDKIINDLKKIAVLQLKASNAAQAAAGSKLVLQMLYNMDKAFVGINDQLGALTTLWQTEKNKVQSAIDALEAKANPNTLLDLVTMPTANANWQKINDFSEKLTTFHTASGKPVVLEPKTSNLKIVSYN